VDQAGDRRMGGFSMLRLGRFSGSLIPPVLAGLVLLVVSCARTPLTSAPPLEIVAGHVMDDGKVIWDPNEDPVLTLSVRGDATDPLLSSIRWVSKSWLVDLSGQIGPDLRVFATTPGCGFGGYEFEVTAVAVNGAASSSIIIRMQPYLCPGSPWTE